MTDKALAARLREHANLHREHLPQDHEQQQWTADLDRAADLIDSMAQAEPVAWAATDESGTVVEALGMNQSRRFDTALYLAPPAREPLSAEQVFADDGIMAANARIGLPLSEIMEITRAVEQAHGIVDRQEDAA